MGVIAEPLNKTAQLMKIMERSMKTSAAARRQVGIAQAHISALQKQALYLDGKGQHGAVIEVDRQLEALEASRAQAEGIARTEERRLADYAQRLQELQQPKKG
jgi:hypothetical protein